MIDRARQSAAVAQRYEMPMPSRLLVFGATGRIGSAVARHAVETSPDTEVLLATSRPEPRADAVANGRMVAASYFDRASLDRALHGVDAIFVVTPSFLDEPTAMGNLIAAVEGAGTVRHIVRIVGDPPGMRLARVPQVLKDFGGGTAVQHLIARDMLERSGLPVTFLNSAASYADNFLRMAPQLCAGTWLMPRDRLIGYVDPAEVGEAAARILLSRDSRHIGQSYHVDNGEKPMRCSAVVELLSDVLGIPITLVLSEERFLEEAGPGLSARYGNDRGGEFMVEYMRFEEANEVAWRAPTSSKRCLVGSPEPFASGWRGPRRTFSPVAGWHRRQREWPLRQGL